MDEEEIFLQRQEEQLKIHRINRLHDAVQTLAPEFSFKAFWSEYRLQNATKIAGLSLYYPKVS